MQTAQPNIFAQSRLPLDVLAIILDNVEGLEDSHRDNATLRPLMLCNKSLYSLALPRLFSHVKLSGIAHFAYALHLQSSANSPLLVKSLQLDWSIEGRYSEGCSCEHQRFAHQHCPRHVPLAHRLEVGVGRSTNDAG